MSSSHLVIVQIFVIFGALYLVLFLDMKVNFPDFSPISLPILCKLDNLTSQLSHGLYPPLLSISTCKGPKNLFDEKDRDRESLGG